VFEDAVSPECLDPYLQISQQLSGFALAMAELGKAYWWVNK
jgi:hypothetical protein